MQRSFTSFGGLRGHAARKWDCQLSGEIHLWEYSLACCALDRVSVGEARPRLARRWASLGNAIADASHLCARAPQPVAARKNTVEQGT